MKIGKLIGELTRVVSENTDVLNMDITVGMDSFVIQDMTLLEHNYGGADGDDKGKDL